MSAEHMGMVFAAEGLDGSEKLLLLGLTNWTDPHGYCWPSEERLADDCGTSRSTVQRAKRKLIKKNLFKAVRRQNSRGEPISNLSRVNLPLLASMARTRDSYDDDLISMITFDDDSQGDPEATLRGTPDAPETPSDLLTRQSDSYPESDRLGVRVNLTHTPSQNDSQSRSYPEGNLSLSARAEAAGVGEREMLAPPEDKTNPAEAGAVVPEQREGGEHAAAAERVVAAYAAALGRPVLNGTRAALGRQAVTLLASGLPESWVCARARELVAHGWTDLVRHAERSTAPVRPVRLDSGVQRGGIPEWCGVCNDGERPPSAAYRFRETDDGRMARCPECHPMEAQAV
ncbi:helix-turn-helix domain-containing protein [Streptomyces syringium]|uniref:helix-turn-helix domain-containing protein n=1 Tax=Streptomyces syringium TaxID=76729 RepID=UPI0033C88ABA